MWGQQVCSGYACHGICVEDRGQLEGAGSVLSPHGLENQTHCHFYPMSLLTSSLPSFEQSLPEPGVPARLAGHQAPESTCLCPPPPLLGLQTHTAAQMLETQIQDLMTVRSIF